LLVVVRRLVSGLAVHLSIVSGATNRAYLGVGATDLLRYSNGATFREASSLAAPATEGWVCLAVSKASGTTTARFHKFVYATGAFSHENASGTALADGLTGGAILLSRATPAGTTFQGSYAAAALFDRALTDAEFEAAAPSLSALKSASPNWGLWALDHALTGQVNEMFIGSSWVAGSASAVDPSGSPLSYGHAVP
jgi:hypothetical protein